MKLFRGPESGLILVRMPEDNNNNTVFNIALIPAWRIDALHKKKKLMYINK